MSNLLIFLAILVAILSFNGHAKLLKTLPLSEIETEILKNSKPGQSFSLKIPAELRESDFDIEVVPHGAFEVIRDQDSEITLLLVDPFALLDENGGNKKIGVHFYSDSY